MIVDYAFHRLNFFVNAIYDSMFCLYTTPGPSKTCLYSVTPSHIALPVLMTHDPQTENAHADDLDGNYKPIIASDTSSTLEHCGCCTHTRTSHAHHTRYFTK